jgi:hypothetical protein
VGKLPGLSFIMTYNIHTLKSGRYISYTSAVGGSAFVSLHKIGEKVTEAEAKKLFHREHKREVLELIRQQNEAQRLIDANSQSNS